jgi:hypothetical protein
MLRLVGNGVVGDSPLLAINGSYFIGMIRFLDGMGNSRNSEAASRQTESKPPPIRLREPPLGNVD